MSGSHFAAYREQMQPGERIDPITGFADTRTLELTANYVLASARKRNHTVSVAIIQLDDADHATERSMSLALRASVRGTDHLFKTAEQTLVVLLPGTSLDGVAKVVMRVARLCDRPFGFGVATTSRDGWHIGQLVVRATSRVKDFPLAF